VGRPLSLDQAVDLTRTGDIWVFRGNSAADRAIRLSTNSPVNHVGMALVLDDLPPLMWHAELGRSLPDMWTGGHHRGVQLHDLRDAVVTWTTKYGQRPWLRQLDATVTREMEDAALRTVARLDGTPFPSTVRLAGRWVSGRLPRLPWQRRDAAGDNAHPSDDTSSDDTSRVGLSDADRGLETAFCAEVVAVTYEEMGLLEPGRRPNWYDPGRFWSGDDLDLVPGASLGGEIEVTVPAPQTTTAASPSR
jgi:hypothetical protein